MKVCKECKEEKEYYYFDKVSKNGYRTICRKCRNTKNTKSFLDKVGNLEKRKEYNRIYQQNHINKNEYYQIYRKCVDNNRSIVIGIKRNIKLSNKQILFKYHIENQFDVNMNWDNYGSYWEIDHIVSGIKMAKNGYSIEDINKLSNLRPLSIKDNRCKNKS
jgi:hypothetical protein